MRGFVIASAFLLFLPGCAGKPEKPRPTLQDLQQRYDWTTTYTTGLHLAQVKNKPVVLFFYHDWCLACRDLVLDMAADERVRDALDHFVMAAVNIRKERGIVKRFGVKKVPDVRFLTPAGREVARLTDRDPAVVARQLERILDGIGASNAD